MSSCCVSVLFRIIGHRKSIVVVFVLLKESIRHVTSSARIEIQCKHNWRLIKKSFGRNNWKCLATTIPTQLLLLLVLLLTMLLTCCVRFWWMIILCVYMCVCLLDWSRINYMFDAMKMRCIVENKKVNISKYFNSILNAQNNSSIACSFFVTNRACWLCIYSYIVLK